MEAVTEISALPTASPASPAEVHAADPATPDASVPIGAENVIEPRRSTPGAQAAKLADDHPEGVIAVAFVGGFLLAAILKRLAR